MILSTAPGKFRHLAAVFLSASVFVDAEIGMSQSTLSHQACVACQVASTTTQFVDEWDADMLNAWTSAMS